MKKQNIIIASSVAAGVVCVGGGLGLYFGLRKTDDETKVEETDSPKPVEPDTPELPDVSPEQKKVWGAEFDKAANNSASIDQDGFKTYICDNGEDKIDDHCQDKDLKQIKEWFSRYNKDESLDKDEWINTLVYLEDEEMISQPDQVPTVEPTEEQKRIYSQQYKYADTDYNFSISEQEFKDYICKSIQDCQDAKVSEWFALFNKTDNDKLNQNEWINTLSYLQNENVIAQPDYEINLKPEPEDEKMWKPEFSKHADKNKDNKVDLEEFRKYVCSNGKYKLTQHCTDSLGLYSKIDEVEKWFKRFDEPYNGELNKENFIIAMNQLYKEDFILQPDTWAQPTEEQKDRWGPELEKADDNKDNLIDEIEFSRYLCKFGGSDIACKKGTDDNMIIQLEFLLADRNSSGLVDMTEWIRYFSHIEDSNIIIKPEDRYLPGRPVVQKVTQVDDLALKQLMSAHTRN